MDTRALTLQQIVGRLSALGTGKEELARFERRLAEHLAADANIAIRGNRLAHELDDVSLREPHRQGDLFARPTPSTGAGSPTVFRRETPFRSDLLGNSVPAWAIGAAPAESFGPFADEHGLPVWFDIFLPAPLVSVTFSGATAPALRARVRRTLTNAVSYRLEPGSIWIASYLIARTPELQGFYTGLRITGGTIDLSQAATVSGDTLILAPTTTVSVHLDLDQRAAPTERPVAGLDAFDATVQLPKTLDLTFGLPSSTLRAAAASCTVFGCDVYFEQSGAPPVWIPLISQILVPFSATTRTSTCRSLRGLLVAVRIVHRRRTRADRSPGYWMGAPGHEGGPPDPWRRRRHWRARHRHEQRTHGPLEESPGEPHAPAPSRDHRRARPRHGARLRGVQRGRPPALDVVAECGEQASLADRARVRTAVSVHLHDVGCGRRRRVLLLPAQGRPRSAGRRERHAIRHPVVSGVCGAGADRRDVPRVPVRHRPSRRRDGRADLAERLFGGAAQCGLRRERRAQPVALRRARRRSHHERHADADARHRPVPADAARPVCRQLHGLPS